MQEAQAITNNVYSLEERRKAALLHPACLTLLPAGSAFHIQILDDSLTGEAIEAGDLIDCERVETVDSGSLALVQTPYGMMMRRYTFTHSYVRLDAANTSFPALCLPHADVSIVARPVRLVRWLAGFTETEEAA